MQNSDDGEAVNDVRSFGMKVWCECARTGFCEFALVCACEWKTGGGGEYESYDVCFLLFLNFKYMY